MSKYRKPATIVLFLLIYFTVLTMVSFMRSTELVAVGENLIDNQKFTVLAAENRAWADGEGLHFNDSEATEKVFSTTISLRDCQQIQVQFTLRNLPGHLCSWWICGQMVTIAQTRNFR